MGPAEPRFSALWIIPARTAAMFSSHAGGLFYF